MSTSAYKILSWFFFMICLNLYISENKIQNIYHDSIMLETQFEKKFECFVSKRIDVSGKTGEEDLFYDIIHTHKYAIYNKFKKMVRFRENIELSTGNIRISLICHNYCEYFKDYIREDSFKLFSKLCPFGSYPKFCDLYFVIDGKDMNFLLYPDICFYYFIKKID